MSDSQIQQETRPAKTEPALLPRNCPDHLLSQEVSNLNGLATIRNVHIDGEVRIDQSQLVFLGKSSSSGSE